MKVRANINNGIIFEVISTKNRLCLLDLNDKSKEENYHFENFTHFGSAVERVKNFEYKIK